MPRRRRGKAPIYKSFGAYLRGLRERYGHSLGRDVTLAMVVRDLTRRGLPIKKALLSEWERGLVEKPDPAVLAGLADLYQEPLLAIIRTLVVERLAQAPQPPEVSLALLATREGTEDVASAPRPPFPLAGYAATETAARLLVMSAELAELAEALLSAAVGGQTAMDRRRAPRDHGRPRTRRG